eukprot:NODE_4831_length_760_cov_11.804501_g4033_i0.p1 GENE.NODE_4831_length_760_cov_11.804501_g4033_i0~~NODE_4831_length_760_cov_11.804501_g4033_i0.p1  ORF type:complete len:165 (-),score=7.73 NODE_4831_length_760_cov_11.804501_g4033_i0:17-511(-)
MGQQTAACTCASMPGVYADRSGPAAAKLLALTSRRPNGPARQHLGQTSWRMHTRASDLACRPDLETGPPGRRARRPDLALTSLGLARTGQTLPSFQAKRPGMTEGSDLPVRECSPRSLAPGHGGPGALGLRPRLLHRTLRVHTPAQALQDEQARWACERSGPAA